MESVTMKTETKPLEWNELWDAMDANPQEWIPTTEAMYWQMLECLPPRKMIGQNFLVGEVNDHTEDGQGIYACFTKFGDTYKVKHLTVAEFMAEHGYIPKKELR
jgi:hypothetical protein